MIERTLFRYATLLIVTAAMSFFVWTAFAKPDRENDPNPGTAGSPETTDWDGLAPSVRAQYSDSKIDPNLLGFVESEGDNARDASSRVSSIKPNTVDGRIRIQVLVDADSLEAVQTILFSLGGDVTGVGHAGFGQDLLESDVRVVQGWMPVETLVDLASRDEVLYVRSPLKALMLKETPGLALPSSFDLSAWHAAGFRGGGVKIGVIDSGFALDSNVVSEIPATEIRSFVDGEPDEPCGEGRRGTQSIEAIHKIAPDAEIYGARVETLVDFQEAVSWLVEEIGVDIVRTTLARFSATPDIPTDSGLASHGGIYWAIPEAASPDDCGYGPFLDRGDGFHLFPSGGNVEIVEFEKDSDSAYPWPSFGALVRWKKQDGANTNLDLHLLGWNGSSWSPVAESARTQPEHSGRFSLEYLSADSIDKGGYYGIAVRGRPASEELCFEIVTSEDNVAIDGASDLTPSGAAGVAALLLSAHPDISPGAIQSLASAGLQEPNSFPDALTENETANSLSKAGEADSLAFSSDLSQKYCNGEPDLWIDHDEWEWTAERAFSAKRLEIECKVVEAGTNIRILVNGSEVASWPAEVGQVHIVEDIDVEIDQEDTVVFGHGNTPGGCVEVNKDYPVRVIFWDTPTPTTGAIQTSIQPQDAIDAGARWRVDGGDWQVSGATVDGLSEGSHSVSYKQEIAGWDTPADDSVIVVPGETKTVYGTYVRQTGSLQVTISPQGAIGAGARWCVDSGAWQKSGDTVGELPVGNHTVTFKSLSGWETPAEQSVSITKNTTAHAFGTYVVWTGLQVTLEPEEAVAAGAKWALDGGEWRESGTAVVDLEPGEYAVSYKTISGWTTPNDRMVEVRDGEVAQANGYYVDRFFTEMQGLQETEHIKISDIESFVIEGETYLAVMNSYDWGSGSADSFIYKWNGDEFETVQNIATNAAMDCESFVIDGTVYLAVANNNDEASYDIDSTVYRWNGAEFAWFQSIPTNGAMDWESFAIGGDTYLSVSNHCSSPTMDAPDYTVDSKIYKWSGASFVEIQAIPTKGAADMETFMVGDETYLAVANHYENESDNTYDIDSKIYRWNGSAFEEFQFIATNGASDWESFEIDGITYLAVANSIYGAESTEMETWEKTYGGENTAEGNSVRQTKDGCYIVAGRISRSDHFGSEGYMVKTDASGEGAWSKYFGEPGELGGYIYSAESVFQMESGDFMLTGTTLALGSGLYLLKTDDSGNEVWRRILGATGDHDGYDLKPSDDGGYIIAGCEYCNWMSPEDSNFLLVKADSSGNLVWRKTFGGDGDDCGLSAQQTADGGYIATGYFDRDNPEVFLIKTDDMGNQVWKRTFDGETGQSVQNTDDGGYIVTGSTTSFRGSDSDVYLLKTDAMGNQIWSRAFGGESSEFGSSVQKTDDGGYIVTGRTSSFGKGDSDVYLIKTDGMGNQFWSKTFGGKDYEMGMSVQNTDCDGYIVAGTTRSFGGANSNAYLIYYKPPFESVNIESRIYKWNGYSFQFFQSIPTSCAGGITHFRANEENYLFVSNQHDGNSTAIDSELYRWNGSFFHKVESIASHAAKKGEFFKVAGNNCLAIPYYEKEYSSSVLKATCIVKQFLFVEEQGICGGMSPCYSKIETAMKNGGECGVVQVAPGTYSEMVVVGPGMTVEIGWDDSFAKTSATDPVIIRGPLF